MPPSEVAPPIEQAFQSARRELEIRSGFPEEVLAGAQRVAAGRQADASTHADHTALELVTIDPPGSRDLDQAVHAERAGDGYRLRYAIADVGFWVDRGSAVEREAWLRGVTYYAPDHREPLYPPVLSQGAASLLAGETRPSLLFDFTLDARGGLRAWTVSRALVRSQAQLTYAQLLAHGTAPHASPLAGEPWAQSLALVAEIGTLRMALEAERGGSSLPVRDQHVQERAAAELGYELVLEAPNAAERWNAEVSLLTGHAAARCMLAAGVGLLRTMAPFDARDVEKFRRIAIALGFHWPEGTSYARFMQALDPAHRHVDVLVRQARRVMQGAEYVSFRGAPPEQPLHGALAFEYAHVTAPLRRLADRYVLDLLMTLQAGAMPTDDEVATLERLPAVMHASTHRANLLERKVVDVAEAWSLRDRVGETFDAVVIDVQRGVVEVHVEEPPIRASALRGEGRVPALGARVRVRLVRADVEQGRLALALVDDAGSSG